MAQRQQLPDFVHRLGRDEQFRFACHPKVDCFTECCRMLELALTPYDALRLRRATGMDSQQLLDTYIIVEHEPGEPFPRFYLTMVDDGRASCVFVGEKGCSVYEHRPAACRTYPLGRAVIRQGERMEEHFVLLKEDHCLGFAESASHDAGSYSQDQELEAYNRFSDKMAAILQHPAIRQGYQPPAEQLEAFSLALYNLDHFREKLVSGELEGPPVSEVQGLTDEQLLELAIDWVRARLFAELPDRFQGKGIGCTGKQGGERQ